MAYQVTLTNFSGPLDLLLQLIERSRLSIHDIPLGEITEQYLTYIAPPNQIPTAEMSRFIALAAILTHIKSRAILATDAEPDEELSALEERLEAYQQYREAARQVDSLWRRPERSFRRNRRLSGDGIPPSNLGLPQLRRAYLASLQRREPLEHPLAAQPVAIREMTDWIHQELREGKQTNLTAIMDKGESTQERAALFFAALELWRQGSVELVQSGEFETITVRYV